MMSTAHIAVLEEMFDQRGYGSVRHEENRLVAEKPDGQIVWAFTTVIEKLNVAEIQNKIAEMGENKVQHAVLVYDGVPTSAVNNLVANATVTGMYIELFHNENLQFNITKHELVPKHVLVPKSEAKQFAGTAIPILLRTDPVARFYDFKVGDVVRIIRGDGQNAFIAYRRVK